MEGLYIHLPQDLASELRAVCSKERRTPSDVVSESISAWLFMRPNSTDTEDTAQEVDAIEAPTPTEHKGTPARKLIHPRKGESCFYVQNKEPAFLMQRQTGMSARDLRVFLSEKLGCDLSVVHRILRGDRAMSYHDLKLIEKLTNSGIQSFVDETKYSISDRKRRTKSRRDAEKKERQSREDCQQSEPRFQLFSGAK